MRLRLVVAVVALLLLALIGVGATASPADEVPGPALGARVRLTVGSLSGPVSEGDKATRRLVGTLIGLDSEALTLEVKKQRDPVVVRRSSLQQLEISRRSSKKAMGALLGFLVGTTAGAVAASASGGSSVCNSTGLSGCDLAIATVVIGLPGALVGALVAPGERWEAAPLGRVGLSVTPTRAHGIKAAISFSF